MSLPVIVPVIAGALGVYGAFRAAKGFAGLKRTRQNEKGAASLMEEADRTLFRFRAEADNAFLEYSRIKIAILTGPVKRFLELFRQLENTGVEDKGKVMLLLSANLRATETPHLKYEGGAAPPAVAGLALGLIAGAIVALLLWKGAMLLATAGTGASISSLKGAAAEGAALAWLGGGPLNTGGFGKAGGAVALALLILGPALFAFGTVFGRKSGRRLKQSKANLEDAGRFKSKADRLADSLPATRHLTRLGADIVQSAGSKLDLESDVVKRALSDHGKDFKNWGSLFQRAPGQGMKLSRIIKAVIDLPVLDTEGLPAIDAKERLLKLKEEADSVKPPDEDVPEPEDLPDPEEEAALQD
jgi:hypothetical protein